MERIFITTLLLLPFLVAAQQGTTLDEYRFLSKGYAYQKSMGLDASKDGYKIQDIAPATTESAFIGLYKEGADQPQAVLLILKCNSTSPFYICLPNNEAPPTVQELHRLDQLQLTDPSLKEAYMVALQQLVFHLMSNGTSVNYGNGAFAKMENTNSDLIHTRVDQQINNGAAALDQKDAENSIPADYDYLVAKGIEEETPDAINTAVAVTLDEIMTERGVFSAPVIKGNYTGNGKVAIKFCVDKNGTVSSAKFTQLGSTTFNSNLIEKAKESVQQAQFAEGETEDCGKVIFYFQ